jgi:hypothetical protein
MSYLDARTPPCVVAVQPAEGELNAGAGPMVVVAAAGVGSVEPEARGAERGVTVRLSRSGIGEDLGQEVGTIPPQALPRLLAVAVKHATKGRTRDHSTARAAAFAGLDDGERVRGAGH